MFKKSQKLLDRFLFLFFSEDRNLLPPNSVRLILEQWKKLKDLDAYTPLYDRFKKYFGYLNTGFKGKQYDVFAYNGGLFKPDTILANITIDDELLYTHTLKLSEYDFESEVDVNILGHIFENSLNELDEVKAQLEGQSVDKTTTKRKKDGVFYTPKYITKYIVENTVGKLCTEKKIELDISDETYQHAKQRSRKRLETLNDYRTWLLQLTICDPACGSGAFLNEALNFLIAEHRYVDELSAKYNNDALMLSDVENSILENNLFGVDLNEESVEIAKLSLWLRTAQPNRKLNSLNHNIKCGNSLIDDPEVAGDKAFKWEEEFPSIFKEKHEKPYHITTTIYDSRTSKRMEKYKVRERREGSTKPHVIYFTPEEDVQMTQIIADVAKEDQLNILAYNICGDHIHLLLVCAIEEIPAIMQKIKGRTSYFYKGHYKGLKPLENKPLWQQKYSPPKEVSSTEQLLNTLKYIQTNRNKHELPPHPKALQNTINALCCSETHAFRTEYTGGFDVVIGNPPYIKEYTNKRAFEGLHSNPCYQGKMDLWYFFGSLALEIIKKDTGLIGYIAPNNWITNSGASVFRNIVLEKGKLIEFIDFGDFKVFEDAGIQTMIYIMSATSNNEKYLSNYSVILDKKNKQDGINSFLVKTSRSEFKFFKTEISKQKLLNKYILFNDSNIEIILDSINSKKDFNLEKNEVAQGIVALQDCLNEKSKNKIGDSKNIGDGIFNLSLNEVESLKLSTEERKLIKPFYTSSELSKYYGNPINNFYVIYTDSTFKKATSLNNFPNIKRHLDQFQQVITSHNKPYGLHRSREEKFFQGAKILSIRKAVEPTFTYTNFDCYVSQTYYSIKTEKIDLKTLTVILNSNMIKFWLKYKGKMQGDLYQIDKEPILNIPIKTPNNQQPFIHKADQMLSLNKDLQELSQKFQRTLLREYESLDKLSKKLETWYALSFADFLKELQKKKVVLSLSKKVELETYFLEEQQKAVALKTQIDQTDKEIDAMVYALYGLTEAEIAIVESC